MSYNYKYDEMWIEEVHVNECAVIDHARQFDRPMSKAWKILESLFLLKAVTLIDLTTLMGDDTVSNVSSIVNKALHPLQTNFVCKILNTITEQLENINTTKLEEKSNLSVNFEKIGSRKYVIKVEGDINNTNKDYDLNYEELLEVKQLLHILALNKGDVEKNLTDFLALNNDLTGLDDCSKKTLRTAAICVYPSFVKDVNNILQTKWLNVNNQNIDSTLAITDHISIAAVAAGFPSGLYDLDSKVKEIEFAIHSGASEIDIVISRYLVIGHRWTELFNEIRALKSACGKLNMKTILAVGECGSLENIYKASMVAMMAGSNYIKTSTGKESTNATFPTGLVMCRAIKNFYINTGKKVGFKPAGGIRTAEDALKWIRLILTELGPDWLPLFRIGASGILSSIEQRLKELHS